MYRTKSVHVYFLLTVVEESDVGGYTSKCAHKFHEMGLEYVACKWIRISWKPSSTRKLSESSIKPSFITIHWTEDCKLSKKIRWTTSHVGKTLKQS